MGRPSRHFRKVATKSGSRKVLVNDDVDPKVKEKNVVTSEQRREIRDAASQLADGGGTALERKFVSALASQGDVLASRSYGMVEVADAFAAGKMGLDECVEKTRSAWVEMETSMAAIEYAASRLSPDFQRDVADAHAALRESSVDAVGYLLDMGDESASYGEKTARGFRDEAAQKVFDRGRESAKVIAEAAQRETAASMYA